MAHSAVFHRKGSNTGSGSSVLSPPANSHVPADDYQPSLLIQCQAPAGSSSPGTHHIPPHSLNLHSQPQPTQPTGAQMKKKSGFQITSVTPAQISVSTNNSIAEDTESYDDLDESHTEDLSSSEILDVSLSRANDVVGAERSSSEETLNNFQEAETPGAISPNQPSHPHTLNQAQQRSGSLVNGTVHPQHPNHAVYSLSSVPASPSSALNSGALTSVTQKMPSNSGVSQESVSQVAHPSINPQPVGVVALGSSPGLHGSAPATTVSIMNPQTSSVSNVNILSSANVPVREGISASGTSGFPHHGMSSSGGAAAAAGGNLIPAASAGVSQQLQHPNNSTVPMTTTSVAAAAAAAGRRLWGGGSPRWRPGQGRSRTSSRFRVVKLDSSSEPFKKGRWTCTEFYDKETSLSSAGDSGSPSARPLAPESSAGASERDSASASSVSSSLSTLSHYSEIVCGGEAGGPPIPQHDYSSLPQGFQGTPQSVGLPQTQTPMLPPEAHSKPGVAPSATANAHPPARVSSLQATNGLPTPAVHQFTYAQAVASPPAAPAQGLVGVKQQKIGTPPSYSPHPLTRKLPPCSQTHQGVLQGQTGSAPPPAGPANGSSPMMGALQQPQTLLHAPPQQPSAHLAPMSGLGSLAGGAAGLGPLAQNHPAHLEHQKPQSLPTQIPNTGQGNQMATPVQSSQVSAPSAPAPNPQSDPQAGSLPSSGRVAPQGIPQNQQSSAGLSQEHSSAQALAHAAQASALYASLPTFTTTQLQDAQRLLLQHQSALLGLPKLPAGGGGGEAASGFGTSQGQDTEGNAAAAASALGASAGSKAVDGEEDGALRMNCVPPEVAEQVKDATRGGRKAAPVPHSHAPTAALTVPLAQQNRLSLLRFKGETLHDGLRGLKSEGCCCHPPKHAGNVLNHGRHSSGSNAAQSAPAPAPVSLPSPLSPVHGARLAPPLVDFVQLISSGASVVAIDNKIEQAMDLVKSHLMYAVREEVEVLKEQIKELIERNSQLEQENTLLKTLASPEQMAQFQAQVQTGSPPAPGPPSAATFTQTAPHSSGPSA
uniref:TSC22 domain family protein 1 n=1 Tax=Tetraodon nigroviridis TaxID=99883 RepID=H3CDQ6_TETNG